MPDDLAETETVLAEHSRSHREFFIPVVRAIHLLGGRGRKRDVVIKVREVLTPALSPRQLDYLERNNRFGWARMDLKRAGLIGGEYGWWELTELGRQYAEAHLNDDISITLDVPDAPEPPPRAIPTETVEVTAFGAYEIPVLNAMADGTTDRAEIFDSVEAHLRDDLRPGDRRQMPSGIPVWSFRTAWALSNLGKDGFAENLSTGQWAITPAGKKRLEEELASWSITRFPVARAKVRRDASDGEAPCPTDHEVGVAWQALRGKIGMHIQQALDARLNPTASDSDGVPPRNVILYGPPGTGKTHVAKQVAAALTGAVEPADDGQFRLVQFHPSYAYEDFIQGLRPDLAQTELRYELAKGPFLKIAEAAVQDPDKFYVLVIDEINRGDPARIFGELLYALEYRGEPITLALGGNLVVPPNLVVIGTMNSVDRSVALVDYALRRRFGFVRVGPNPEVIGRVRPPGLLADLAPVVLEKFNEWLADRLDRDHEIGHSYFISPALPNSLDGLRRVWDIDVRPLLEEYFFGDEPALTSATRAWDQIVRRESTNLAELESDEDSLG